MNNVDSSHTKFACTEPAGMLGASAAVPLMTTLMSDLSKLMVSKSETASQFPKEPPTKAIVMGVPSAVPLPVTPFYVCAKLASSPRTKSIVPPPSEASAAYGRYVRASCYALTSQTECVRPPSTRIF